jgi:hypothetical protein
MVISNRRQGDRIVQLRGSTPRNLCQAKMEAMRSTNIGARKAVGLVCVPLDEFAFGICSNARIGLCRSAFAA